MAIIMKGYLCILLFGLAVAIRGAEISSGGDSESKDLNFKDGNYNLEKTKRGAVKISNADNPGFNHLTSTNSNGGSGGHGSSGGSSSSSSGGLGGLGGVGFKPFLPAGVPPFRYIQSNQFQPVYTTAYLQPSHSAAQIAAQYSFQGAPVAHYIQTPTQVQYVSTPTVAQVPFMKFQNFGGDYSTGGSVPDASASSSSTSSSSASSSSSSSSSSPSSTQHSSAHAHQGFSSGSGSQVTSSAVQSGVQPREYFFYQAPKPVYYTQQPFLTFFVQPQAAASANFLYQQPGVNYFYKQQPQQYLSFHGGNRFGVYPTSHASQLTYLVPMTVSSGSSHDGLTGNELKSSPSKALTGSQHSNSASSFAYGTKG